jgi:ribosomal protein S18 acetylase RimI-like enzyme
VVPVGGFTAFFHPTDPLRYLNYAIPEAGAEPTTDEIDLLRTAFRERERRPRLEWIEEASPQLAAVLEAAGMSEELRSPLMAAGPDEIVEPKVDRASVAVAEGERDLRDAANVQHVAFGGKPLADDEPVPERSGGAVLARIDGEPVSAGSWTKVSDGYSEIVGIATAEQWRGRGLAGLVTAAAARAAFAAGASTCVLSPGDETALRVYERAGFRRVATMLHYSDPA